MDTVFCAVSAVGAPIGRPKGFGILSFTVKTERVPLPFVAGGQWPLLRLQTNKYRLFVAAYGRGAQRMLVYHPASVTHCQRRLAAKFLFI